MRGARLLFHQEKKRQCEDELLCLAVTIVTSFVLRGTNIGCPVRNRPHSLVKYKSRYLRHKEAISNTSFKFP
jgi:hypothetical protein